jgi:hypothetical protein
MEEIAEPVADGDLGDLGDAPDAPWRRFGHGLSVAPRLRKTLFPGAPPAA